VKKEITHFNVNGRTYEVLITPNLTLSELLRDQMGLTGTKNACGVGECSGGVKECLPDGSGTRCSTMPGGSADAREDRAERGVSPDGGKRLKE